MARGRRDETNSNILPPPSTRALSNQLKPQRLWKRSLSHLRLFMARRGRARRHWGWVPCSQGSQGWTTAATSSVAPMGPASSARARDQHSPSVLSFPNLPFSILSPAQAELCSFSSPRGHYVRLKPQTTVSVPTAVRKHHRAARAHLKRSTPTLCNFCLPPASKGLEIPSPFDCN